MKRLLLPLIAAFVLPAQAGVAPEVHNLCKDVKDYLGCVKAQSNSGKNLFQKLFNKDNSSLSQPKESTSRIPQLEDSINTKYEKCIRRMAKTRPRIDQVSPDLGTVDYDTICRDFASRFQVGDLEARNDALNHALNKVGLNSKGLACPEGKEKYFETYSGFLGIGSKTVDLGCMSEAQMDSYKLRQEIKRMRRANTIGQINIQNSINSLKNQVSAPIYCSSNYYGRTAYTSCY